MKRLSILALLLLCIGISTVAQTAVRFGNETNDTTAITHLLQRGSACDFRNAEEAVAFYGRSFIDTPYAAHTLEGEPEMLTVRIDSLDCTTFVETAMALAFTSMERRSSWRDFVYNLQRIRYRGGEVDGYASRLHYIADWAVDNKHRGNFTDVSDSFPRVSFIVRTIDFMTRHRDKYPALADSVNYARIKAVESGYHSHRFPYIKSSDTAIKSVKAAFHNGDVIALVSSLRDLDVTHMGIIVKESRDAEPYVLHASSADGKVEISTRPLDDFLKKNRQWIGVRVFRLTE